MAKAKEHQSQESGARLPLATDDLNYVICNAGESFSCCRRESMLIYPPHMACLASLTHSGPMAVLRRSDYSPYVIDEGTKTQGDERGHPRSRSRAQTEDPCPLPGSAV